MRKTRTVDGTKATTAISIRLTVQERDDLAAYVATLQYGPTLAGYVRWLIGQALKEAKKSE